MVAIRNGMPDMEKTSVENNIFRIVGAFKEPFALFCKP